MGTSKDTIAYAASQIGYHEGYANGHWDNIEKYAAMVPALAWANGYAWCAVFDFACLVNGKNGTGGLVPTASVANLYQQGKNLGRFTEYPTVGALMVLGAGEHTGIVEKFDSDYVWTIEGNTNDTGGSEGDGVYRHKRLRSASNLTGYVIPYYDEDAVSADPSWSGKWLGSGEKPATKTTTTVTAASSEAPATTTTTTSAVVATVVSKPFSLTRLIQGIRGAKNGVASGNVALVQQALQAKYPHSYAKVDGIWRQYDTDLYAHWQTVNGYTGTDANGVPGPATLQKLLSPKFHVIS